VGYPSAVNRLIPSALTDHGVTDYTLVYAYHANETDTWKRYAPDVPVNDLLELVPGWSYWIKVSAPNTWILPIWKNPWEAALRSPGCSARDRSNQAYFISLPVSGKSLASLGAETGDTPRTRTDTWGSWMPLHPYGMQAGYRCWNG